MTPAGRDVGHDSNFPSVLLVDRIYIVCYYVTDDNFPISLFHKLDIVLCFNFVV